MLVFNKHSHAYHLTKELTDVNFDTDSRLLMPSYRGQS